MLNTSAGRESCKKAAREHRCSWTQPSYHRRHSPATQPKFPDACTSKDVKNRVLSGLQCFTEAVTNFPTRKAQWVLVAHAGRPVKMFSYCFKKRNCQLLFLGLKLSIKTTYYPNTVSKGTGDSNSLMTVS